MGPDNAVKIIEARMQVRVPIKAGPRAIGVTFVQKTGALPPTLLQPYLSTLDPVDSDGVPRFEAVTISGPFKATGRRRHAEPPPDLHLPPGRHRYGGRRDGLRPADRHDAGAARLPPPGRRRRPDAAARVLPDRPRQGRASTPASSWRCSASSPIPSSSSAPSATRDAVAAVGGVPHQRSRAGVAPVVLPLEQHSRTTSC